MADTKKRSLLGNEIQDEEDNLPPWMSKKTIANQNGSQEQVDRPSDAPTAFDADEDGLPPWMSKKNIRSIEPKEKPIDEDMEAPNGLRLAVSGLTKPEDKLAAIRKQYPDAEPHGDANFVMTDPETGKRFKFNQEGWMPSLGDFADATPEIVGGVTGTLGSIAGAVAGGASGSVIPIAGTTTGALAGGTALGSAGYAAGKDITSRALNLVFGNKDTRSTTDQLIDTGKDVAVGAAGELGGQLIVGPLMRGASKAVGGLSNKFFAGGAVDDAASAASRLSDFDAFGMKPTGGMVSQNPRALRVEQAAKEVGGNRITQMYDDVQTGLADKFVETSANASSKQTAGEGLRAGAQKAKQEVHQKIAKQYADLDTVAGGLNVAGDNVTSVFKELNKAKLDMSDYAKHSKGALMDEAVKTAKSINDTVKKGLTFSEAQTMRSDLGKLAFSNETDPFLATQYKRLYDAVDQDMAKTAKGAGDNVFDMWKSADAAYKERFKAGGADKVLNPLVKKDSGEEAFKVAANQIKDGGTKVANIRSTLVANGGEDAWNGFKDTYLRDLGTKVVDDGNEVFDFNTFRNGYNRMSKEAKEAFFEGSTGKAQQESYERIIRISENVADKKNLKGETGRANSLLMTVLNKGGAGATIGAGIGGTVGGMTGAAVGAGVGTAVEQSAKKLTNTYSQRLLANPQTARWIAGLTNAPMQKGGVSAYIGQLKSLSVDAATKAAIRDYLRDIGEPEETK